MLLCEPSGESNLQLHASHGNGFDDLHAIELTTSAGTSPLQAFLAEYWDHRGRDQLNGNDPNAGLACHVEDSQLCLRDSEGCTRSISSILLAEVFCASLESGIVLIAIIPPLPTHSGCCLEAFGLPRQIVRGWFLLFRGPESYLAIVDAFSQVGCLRNDLEIAFPGPLNGNDTLGQGACAVVYKAQNWNGAILAVKKINATVGCAAIAREMSTLIVVQRHENIVGVHGLFWERDVESLRFSIVFERANMGDLLTKVCKDGPFMEDDARPIFIGILKGLAHIHSYKIAHRDIKTENILLHGDAQSLSPRIADFGLATWLSDDVQMSQRCGSPGYVAPEVCLGRKYGCKVDVFGFGIVLYFSLSKEMPFFGKDATSTLKKTVACQLHLSRAPWNGVTSPLRKMLRATICKDVDERLDASKALEHIWLKPPSERLEEEEGRSSMDAPPQGYVCSNPPTVDAAQKIDMGHR